MIFFILGVLSGFSLCGLFSYVGIKNRDDEIELLNKKLEKYDTLLVYDDKFFIKKGYKDEDTNINR